MTTLEIKAMVEKYGITDNGDGNMRIANGSEAQKNAAAIKGAKSDILAFLAAEKAAKDETHRARQSKINSIAGLSKLQSVIAEHDEYQSKFNRAMETGSSRMPARPAFSVEEVSAMYPVAASFVLAEAYSFASNYGKNSAGKKALERIINGENHETVINDMENEWSAYASANID